MSKIWVEYRAENGRCPWVVRTEHDIFKNFWWGYPSWWRAHVAAWKVRRDLRRVPIALSNPYGKAGDR